MKRHLFPAVVVLLSVGCQMPTVREEHLPHLAWPGVSQALAAMQVRDAALRTQRAQGQLQLTHEGESVQLDAALLLDTPAEGSPRLRLRAWKLGRTVFDLTVTAEGTWFLDGTGSADPGAAAAGLARLGAALPQLSGGHLWAGAKPLDESADVFRVQRPDGAVLTVVKATQSLRRVEVKTPEGPLAIDFTFAAVPAADGTLHLLPQSVNGTAPDGARFAFVATKLEANIVLPATAFTPPPAAKKG